MPTPATPEPTSEVKTGPKTQEEIDAEVVKLKAIKPCIRRYSSFNDDHYLSIDAQIEVLEQHLNDDEINDRFENSDVNSAAYQAFQWRNGEPIDDGSPSAGWESLRIK